MSEGIPWKSQQNQWHHRTLYPRRKSKIWLKINYVWCYPSKYLLILTWLCWLDGRFRGKHWQRRKLPTSPGFNGLDLAHTQTFYWWLTMISNFNRGLARRRLPMEIMLRYNSHVVHQFDLVFKWFLASVTMMLKAGGLEAEGGVPEEIMPSYTEQLLTSHNLPFQVWWGWGAICHQLEV